MTTPDRDFAQFEKQRSLLWGAMNITMISLWEKWLHSHGKERRRWSDRYKRADLISVGVIRAQTVEDLSAAETAWRKWRRRTGL
jgi:hypothetical protein